MGDFLGMIMLGYKDTVSVTMEDMIHHIRPVVKGAPDTFIVGDMPFGSYNKSAEQGVENATRMIKETGCDCVKLEGGVKYAPLVRAIVDGGISVMGHIGLTPRMPRSSGASRFRGDAGERETAHRGREGAGEGGCLFHRPGVYSEGRRQNCQPSGENPHPRHRCRSFRGLPGAGHPRFAGHVRRLKPKFVKIYANVRKVMVDGLNQFHKETLSGEFPSDEYSFNKEVDLEKLY